MRTSEQVAGMPCPVCKVPLALADREGIEIDYCPQCRGVWLDRGELDKIIDRSADAPPSRQAPLPQYQQPSPFPGSHSSSSYGYGHKGYKKQKHWLEKIFD
jgi:uncharacterized protein